MARRETSSTKKIASLIFVSNNHQGDASNQRDRAKDRRKRNGFLFFRSGFERSDVDHLLAGCIGDPPISKRKNREDNQNNADKDGWFHNRSSYLPRCV